MQVSSTSVCSLGMSMSFFLGAEPDSERGETKKPRAIRRGLVKLIAKKRAQPPHRKMVRRRADADFEIMARTIRKLARAASPISGSVTLGCLVMVRIRHLVGVGRGEDAGIVEHPPDDLQPHGK